MSLSKEFTKFFQGLEKNNTKEWFDAHRKDYETYVKEPFYNLVVDLTAEMKKLDPRVDVDPKKTIFRIHKDIRFSKDKSPYKLHVASIINRAGKREAEVPGLYLQIQANRISMGSGMYFLSKETLEDVRIHILHNMKALQSIVRKKDFVTRFGEVQGEKAKRLTPELMAGAEKEPLILNKQFYLWHDWEKPKFTEKELVKEVMSYYKTSQPFNAFLEEAMR